jgi:hypothetical protein
MLVMTPPRELQADQGDVFGADCQMCHRAKSVPTPKISRRPSVLRAAANAALNATCGEVLIVSSKLGCPSREFRFSGTAISALIRQHQLQAAWKGRSYFAVKKAQHPRAERIGCLSEIVVVDNSGTTPAPFIFERLGRGAMRQVACRIG